jgi:putative ABC transport system permease protein
MLSTWVLLTLLGFNKGYENSLSKNIDEMGFQVVLTAKGCPYEAATLMLKGGTGLRYMPENIVEEVMSKKEVLKATKQLMNVVFDPNIGDTGANIVYLGIDENYPSMKPYLKFKQGGWFVEGTSKKQVIIGYEAAELEQREVGDIILINEEDFDVIGVLERTGTQDDGMIYLPLGVAQEIFNKKNELTMLGIKLKNDVNQDKFEEKLYKLPDIQVVSMAQVKNTIMGLVSSAKVIVMSVAVIAFLIAMFGVLNTILMSVFERYQEIGILKSMGAMPADIFKMILVETTILCSIGGLLGIIFSYLFSNLSEILVRRFLPFTPNGQLIIIDKNMILFSFISIVLVGIIGGIYPSVKASIIRPLDSIRN